MTKAKHAWDSSFASGGDLFLESGDSHLLATTLAGLLARWLPLTAVAWTGRVLGWALMAYAWGRLTRVLQLPSIARPLSLLTWLLAIQYAHWAGEWAAGGFEAKSIAYPLAFLGIAAALQRAWGHCWVWLGVAIAWHPVAAGWIGLTLGVYWLFLGDRLNRLRYEFPWMLGGAAIAMIGLIPAASGLGGVDRDGSILAPAVHVFMRLQHHMRPLSFDATRHWCAIVQLLLLGVLTIGWSWAARRREELRRWTPLIAIAWASVGFSLIGLGIDYTLSTRRPDIAAKLLRFYWFRWSDIAVPLAWSLIAWKLSASAWLPRRERSPADPDDHPSAHTTAWSQWTSGGLLAATTLGGFAVHLYGNWNQTIPEADQLLVHARGPYSTEADPTQGRRYIEWLAVCDWIRDNTPSDSLWFTPKYQQTFKWYAQRAEVVCWKDVPQDNRAVIEWYKRIQACDLPRGRDGQPREWTTTELLQLAQRYGFRWILLDRTFQQTPPKLEIVYPIGIANRSFAICRIREGVIPHATEPLPNEK